MTLTKRWLKSLLVEAEGGGLEEAGDELDDVRVVYIRRR